MMAQSTSAKRGHRAPAGDGELLRAQLLDAAEVRIAEFGFGSVSLRQVARDVGVSATSVYLHFSSKEELIVEACNRRFGDLSEVLGEALATETDPIEKIRACGRAYIRFGLENPHQYAVMVGVLPLEQVLQHIPVEDLVGLSILVDLAAVIRDGIEQGVFRNGDPDVMVYSLWCIAHGAVGVIDHMGPLLSKPVEEYIDDATHSALLGLGVNADLLVGDLVPGTTSRTSREGD